MSNKKRLVASISMLANAFQNGVNVSFYTPKISFIFLRN